MSVHVLRSRPFCNRPFVAGSTTPAQEKSDSGTIRGGALWDGTTFSGVFPPADTFGSGTFYPVGLTGAQLALWYWPLDEWEFRVNFGWGTDPAGPFTPFTIDYDEFPDNDTFPLSPYGVPDPSLPLNRRILGRAVNILPIKSVGGGNYAYAQLTMKLGDVLIDLASSPRLYYPFLYFIVAPFDADAFPQQFDESVAHLGGTDSGLTFTIDDQCGLAIDIPIWRRGVPSGSPVITRFVSGDAKPTGYLTG